MNRKALGRGLEALIPRAEDRHLSSEDQSAVATEEPASIAPASARLDRIRPNPFQPRTRFDDGPLQELAASIRENGLIQPLVVRPTPDGMFELIAGERRFLASRIAGLTEVPVVLREATQREMLEIALVENLQREDLNAIEEAEAYQRLAMDFGMTQDDIATRVGKSRTAVTNALRLLGLSQEIQTMLSEGTLSAGHARALLALSEDVRRKTAREIVEKGLSVREVEARSQMHPARKAKPTARKRSHPALEVWEGRLRDRFGTQVRIVGGIGRGRVEIHYFSGEDLERILDLSGAGSAL
jgi:ParB family chromosome partitioning protein